MSGPVSRRPVPADAFRIGVENGRIVLELGQSGTGPGGDRSRIAVGDRVELEASVAARLCTQLREALARRPQVSSLAADGDSLGGPAGTGVLPVNLPPDPAADAAARLLDAVGRLGVPYGLERSFRLSPGRLQGQRFLASVNRAELGADASAVLAVFPGVTPALGDAAAEALDRAHVVHVGFEAGDGEPVFKLYAERRVGADEAAAGEPVELHRAWKWRAGEAPVESVYRWHPGLDAAGIGERLRHLFGEAFDSTPAQVALQVVGVAASRSPRLQYLEVDEPGTDRRSFDLNVYDAGLQMRELQAQWLALRDHFGVRPGQFQALLDQVRTRICGHVSGGVHRDGQPFFTVYHGAEMRPPREARLV